MIIEPLRVMRDQIYGVRSTDNNWNHCREKWVEDEEWLVRAYNRLPKPLKSHSDLPWPKVT